MSLLDTRRPQIFPQLTPEQIEIVRRVGEVRKIEPGATLFTQGDRHTGFFVVLEGTVQVFRVGAGGDEQTIVVHRPGEFTGEISTLAGRAAVSSGRAGPEGATVLALDEQALRTLVLTAADLGEIVMRAFILRRVALIEEHVGGLLLVGSAHSSDTHRLREFLTRNGQPFAYLDVEQDPDTGAVLDRFGVAPDDIPVVICGASTLLRNPSNRALADCVGIAADVDCEHLYDVVVVGAGPAGLAAAVYATSEGLSTLVLDTVAPGGQAGTSSKIENYLGFPTGISGQALAGRAFVQAQKFGADIAIPRSAVRLACGQGWPLVEIDDGKRVHARTVVIATGARYRKPELPALERYEGRGIYYGASHVEAQLCSDHDVIVIGGGNSAGQASVFLAGHARRVYHLVRATGLAESMSRYLVRRIEGAPNITLLTETELVALEGDGDLERVRWRHNPSGREEEHEVPHVFIFIGADPNTAWLGGCVVLDDKGFVKTGSDLGPEDLSGAGWKLRRPPLLFETSHPGVFAVGDVRSGSMKRVASAVGEGAASVPMVHRVLAG